MPSALEWARYYRQLEEERRRSSFGAGFANAFQQAFLSNMERQMRDNLERGDKQREADNLAGFLEGQSNDPATRAYANALRQTRDPRVADFSSKMVEENLTPGGMQFLRENAAPLPVYTPDGGTEIPEWSPDDIRANLAHPAARAALGDLSPRQAEEIVKGTGAEQQERLGVEMLRRISGRAPSSEPGAESKQIKAARDSAVARGWQPDKGQHLAGMLAGEGVETPSEEDLTAKGIADDVKAWETANPAATPRQKIAAFTDIYRNRGGSIDSLTKEISIVRNNNTLKPGELYARAEQIKKEIMSQEGLPFTADVADAALSQALNEFAEEERFPAGEVKMPPVWTALIKGDADKRQVKMYGKSIAAQSAFLSYANKKGLALTEENFVPWFEKQYGGDPDFGALSQVMAAKGGVWLRDAMQNTQQDELHRARLAATKPPDPTNLKRMSNEDLAQEIQARKAIFEQGQAGGDPVAVDVFKRNYERVLMEAGQPYRRMTIPALMGAAAPTGINLGVPGGDEGGGLGAPTGASATPALGLMPPQSTQRSPLPAAAPPAPATPDRRVGLGTGSTPVPVISKGKDGRTGTMYVTTGDMDTNALKKHATATFATMLSAMNTKPTKTGARLSDAEKVAYLTQVANGQTDESAANPYLQTEAAAWLKKQGVKVVESKVPSSIRGRIDSAVQVYAKQADKSVPLGQWLLDQFAGEPGMEDEVAERYKELRRSGELDRILTGTAR